MHSSSPGPHLELQLRSLRCPEALNLHLNTPGPPEPMKLSNSVWVWSPRTPGILISLKFTDLLSSGDEPFSDPSQTFKSCPPLFAKSPRQSSVCPAQPPPHCLLFTQGAEVKLGNESARVGEGLQVHKWEKCLFSGFSFQERLSLSFTVLLPQWNSQGRGRPGGVLAVTYRILETTDILWRYSGV